MFHSDLLIELEGGHDVKAHKFILSARGDSWGVADLAAVSELDMTGWHHVGFFVVWFIK